VKIGAGFVERQARAVITVSKTAHLVQWGVESIEEWPLTEKKSFDNFIHGSEGPRKLANFLFVRSQSVSDQPLG
jgi:hypothetical protein